jgi:hypothetical protein
MDKVVLKIVCMSSIWNIDVNERIDWTKIITIPNNFRAIPAFIKSDILTLLFDNIIAFGGVAKTTH